MAGRSSKKKHRKTVKDSDPPRKQYFSFPPDVIKYLWKNPQTANGLLKLYESCKYFFSKRRILIVPKNVCFDESNVLFDNTRENLERINAEYWLNCKIITVINFFERFHKILRCTISHLQIKQSLLMIEDFNILVSEKCVKYFYFHESSVIYPDGKNVPFDILFPKIQNVHVLYYLNDHEKYSFETLQKLNTAKIRNWNNLRHLALNLDSLSETFDPSLFSEFIMKYSNSNIRLDIGIQGNNAEQFKLSLKKNIDSIFNRWKLQKPKLSFHGRLPAMENIIRYYFDFTTIETTVINFSL